MTDDTMHEIDNGKLVELTVDGHKVLAGLSIINGETQLAYLPPSSHRHEPGDYIAVECVRHKILDARQSDLVPRMVVLVVEE